MSTDSKSKGREKWKKLWCKKSKAFKWNAQSNANSALIWQQNKWRRCSNGIGCQSGHSLKDASYFDRKQNWELNKTAFEIHLCVLYYSFKLQKSEMRWSSTGILMISNKLVMRLICPLICGTLFRQWGITCIFNYPITHAVSQLENIQ